MPANRRLLPRRPSPARGASIEAAFERQLGRLFWRRGWRPQVIAYTGYGSSTGYWSSNDGKTDGDTGDGWVRVLARVLLLPAGDPETKHEAQRGWRQFLTVAVDDVEVAVEVGSREHVVRSRGGGYVDVVLPWGGGPGWHDIRIIRRGSAPVTTRVRVVGPEERNGLISDIDDTVMVTAIPRPLLAFWNSFVRLESTRKPVPGMPDFFRRVLRDHPGAFVAYLSTGAWNVAPSIQRFLRTHGYPEGPLLMTDWGPSTERWFRSGRAHKHATLRRLAAEFPHLTWVLIGDDGQHDPQLYDDLICDCPTRVDLVAIRQLSATEQVLTHGTPAPLPDVSQASSPPSTEKVRKIQAPDGCRLLEEYEGDGLEEASDLRGRLDAPVG